MAGFQVAAEARRRSSEMRLKMFSRMYSAVSVTCAYGDSSIVPLASGTIKGYDGVSRSNREAPVFGPGFSI